MKSSLKKLRGFALQESNPNTKAISVHPPSPPLDELSQATLDMQDMRNCYDSLLSAAAAAINGAFEFSESLRDMGACLLEKAALNDDEESGSVLLMLGKVQFELQKLVDSYRSHIIQTITTPSESLLNELRTVEEMKRQCDEKRNIYEHMMVARREKGRSRSSKGESVSAQQLQRAQEEYNEEATLFGFRLKSLKQGLSRSLLTQAARYHASQLTFFKKGLRSLEAVEPHIKLVAERQHIDYQFSGLEDDDAEDGDDGHDANDNGELSFDYGQNDHGQDVPSPSRNSMELDQMDQASAPVSALETAKEDMHKNLGHLHAYGRGPRTGSQSAPLFPDRKFDPAEKARDTHPSSTRKFHAYVLPTPVDVKCSSLAQSSKTVPAVRQASVSGRPHNLWHSSPLEPRKHVKDSRGDQLSDRGHTLKTEMVLKESNNASNRIPPPLAEGLQLPQSDLHTDSNTKKVKRHAISGPLTSKAWSEKPILYSSGPISSSEHPHLVTPMLARIPMPHPSVSPKVSPSTSPPLISSPKISELHELPRPPVSLVDPTRTLVGHSAPLVSRGQELSSTNKIPLRVSQAASPLPMPPGSFPRSYSIPSSRHGATPINMVKLEVSQNQDTTREVASPPLTPIPFANVQPSSTASESISRPRET
ncbi:uncharacterized protein At2g33490-like isoform X2 [Magnolia sinica]|uniref:uncharacterized protein At2g33490-like isoform X2 n=1 Tax=Magnolia sinica TaxID=86752 RepID=UPI00265937F3|nr:uncharacterized protein At2g33490-like isoform X2 [Magnolia sinica]